MCPDRRAYLRHCATHLRKASCDSHYGSNFATDRTLKINSPRKYFLQKTKQHIQFSTPIILSGSMLNIVVKFVTSTIFT